MRVVAGIIAPLDADRAKNPYRVEEIYKGLDSLDHVLTNAGTISIPQRRAFVIIGGKNSMCTELGGWNNRKIKFVTQAGTTTCCLMAESSATARTAVRAAVPSTTSATRKTTACS